MAEKKEGIIETEVDSLMSLLESKKKISVPDAAKTLKVSSDIIEKWANFLEEEGLLKIQYQLTTPYLIWEESEEDVKIEGEKIELKEGEMPKSDIEGVKPVMAKDEKTGMELELPEAPEKDQDQAPVESVRALLEEARGYIREKRFDKAKQTYIELQAMFNELPIEFLTKKNEIEDDLIKISNEMSIEMENKLLTDMRTKTVEISRLIKQAYQFSKLAKIDESIKVYNQIKSIYSSLPIGFFKEKSRLADAILSLYNVLNQSKSKRDIKKLDRLKIEITQHLAEIRQNIGLRKVDMAIQIYELLRKKYDKLPTGFLEEKIQLQKEILNVYTQLVDSKTSDSLNELNTKLEKIRSMVNEINGLVRQKDIPQAVEKYASLRELYLSMPKGFIKQETKIKSMILETYKNLVINKNDISISVIEEGNSKIKKLLKKSIFYLERKEFDLSFEYYKEIIDSYNLLPKGFDETKTGLRNGILKLYYDLVSQSDIIELGELDEYTKEHYFKLLKLLVGAHKIIDNNEFNLIPETYQNIYNVYNKLPLSIVQRKTRIQKEIRKVYALYILYKDTLNMDELIKENQLYKIKTRIGGLRQNIDIAKKESPEDNNFLQFVEERYADYINAIGESERYAEAPSTMEPQKIGHEPMQERRPVEKPVFHEKEIKNLEHNNRYLHESIETRRSELNNIVHKDKVELHLRQSELKNQISHLEEVNKLYDDTLYYVSIRDYNQSLLILKKLLEIEPGHTEARELYNDLISRRKKDTRSDLVGLLIKDKKKKAITLMAKGEYNEAIDQIVSILELDPDNVEARHMLTTAKSEVYR